MVCNLPLEKDCCQFYIHATSFFWYILIYLLPLFVKNIIPVKGWLPIKQCLHNHSISSWPRTHLFPFWAAPLDVIKCGSWRWSKLTSWLGMFSAPGGGFGVHGRVRWLDSKMDSQTSRKILWLGFFMTFCSFNTTCQEKSQHQNQDWLFPIWKTERVKDVSSLFFIAWWLVFHPRWNGRRCLCCWAPDAFVLPPPLYTQCSPAQNLQVLWTQVPWHPGSVEIQQPIGFLSDNFFWMNIWIPNSHLQNWPTGRHQNFTHRSFFLARNCAPPIRTSTRRRDDIWQWRSPWRIKGSNYQV